MTIQDILLIICIVYIVIQLVKSVIMGPAFSILKFFLHGEDYIKWFKFKQTYISPKKRINFGKNKPADNKKA